jgi:hypothetical protein
LALSLDQPSGWTAPTVRPVRVAAQDVHVRRDLSRWAALAAYLLLAFCFFGIRLLLHGGQTFLGFSVDPEIFIWSFAWWPHAILHGQDPFVTHAIWAPSGANLAWATSVPALALIFAPLTLAFGALVSYNVACVLLPALAAWTAFLLCRHVTHSFWPSLAGGYLFGFSSYMLGALEGHVHLSSVFLLPLVALFVLRYLDGSLGGRGLAIRLGVLLALELGFSTEVAFTLTLALAVSLVLVAVLVPALRARVLTLLPPLAAGYALAALLAGPLLYYALSDFHPSAINPGTPATADLANVVVPTDLVAVGRHGLYGITKHFNANRSEQVAYLGPPALLILGWFGVAAWRRAAGRFLLAAIAVGGVASLGAQLHVVGHRVLTLPWHAVWRLPLFDNVFPARLAVYVVLALAVVVALWASAREVPRGVQAALTLLAVLGLVPNPTADAWRTTVREPPFVTRKLYERCLAPSDNVLFLPFGRNGDSMLWQAGAGFRFRMASGYLSPSPPAAFTHPPAVAELARNGELPDDDLRPLREYVRLKRVTVIAVDARVKDVTPWPRLLRRLATPTAVGGVLLYRVGGTSRAGCA